MRKDQLLIRDFNLPDMWTICILQPLSVPPLPMDLRGRWSPGGWIIRNMRPRCEGLWISAFDGSQEWLTSDNWSLTNRLDARSDTMKRIGQYSQEEVECILDGWYTRQVIDSFQQRWANIFNPYGGFKKERLLDAVKDITDRMRTLLEIIPTEITARHQVDGAHIDTISSLQNMVDRIRDIWLYQELCLLRSELWVRFHNSYNSMYSRYEERVLPWQRCWFETDSSPVIMKHITKRLCKVV